MRLSYALFFIVAAFDIGAYAALANFLAVATLCMMVLFMATVARLEGVGKQEAEEMIDDTEQE